MKNKRKRKQKKKSTQAGCFLFIKFRLFFIFFSIQAQKPNKDRNQAKYLAADRADRKGYDIINQPSGRADKRLRDNFIGRHIRFPHNI